MTDLEQQDERALLLARIRRLEKDLNTAREANERERRSNGSLALELYEARAEVKALADEVTVLRAERLRIPCEEDPSVIGAVVVTREMAEAHYDAGGCLEFTSNDNELRQRRLNGGWHEWRAKNDDGRWMLWTALPMRNAIEFDGEPGFYTLLPIEPIQQNEDALARTCGAE